MSPASLRRYRAERLLREEFRALRASVTASVRARLRACGAELDHGDLDACYAQAWQGLYAVTLRGEEVLDPAAWLAVATFRRAIDEHRAARRRGALAEANAHEAGLEPLTARVHCGHGADPAGELDRRVKLGHLFEALRLRLSARERRAFALCYLHGLSRAEAAAAMGISERRMRKLLDGRGAGEAGMSTKVSALVHTIRDERWCEEQGSLMRGLAYGVLDPDGERHRLALIHTHACPACRSYVASLRGLAALLPPVPGMVALVAAAGGAARSATRHAIAGGRASGAAAARGGGGGLAAPATAASGAAGAGAAGGGWLFAGAGAGAKLAGGCLLALGLGAGCAVIAVPGATPRRGPPAHLRGAVAPARVGGPAVALDRLRAARPPATATANAPGARSASSESAPTPAARANREFGPERALAAEAWQAPVAAEASAPRASASRNAAVGHEFAPAQRPSGSASSPQSPAAPGPGPVTETIAAERAPAATAATAEGGPAQAQREFSPG
jgi:DNA-directed RNA polymerase specialized sigma24 family protein